MQKTIAAIGITGLSLFLDLNFVLKKLASILCTSLGYCITVTFIAVYLDHSHGLITPP